MRVGIYTVDVPASLGGGYVLRDDLNRAAVAFEGRHQFELVTIPPYMQIPSRFKRRLNRLRGRPTFIKTPVAEQLAQEVADRKLDILWFNHVCPIDVGVPYILNIFDLQHRLQPWFPEVSAEGAWNIREKTWADAVRRAAIVTVGSPEARAQLSLFYGVPLENIQVLPFPTPQKSIDLALGKVAMPEKQDIRAKYGIKGDFIFYPAQFWPHKNHVNLLHALKILHDRGLRISLVLTGADHGNLSFVVKTAKDLGLEELVHFCGFVPYEDILTFYREALALCYVSLFGPENLPPLEAMALGCPVILSDIPGVHALHGDGPILVDALSPSAIADGVASLKDNPGQIPDRIKSGRTVALQNNADNYLAAFQDMLSVFEPFRRCWP